MRSMVVGALPSNAARGDSAEEADQAGSREDKLAVIERDNPRWNDLYETLNA